MPDPGECRSAAGPSSGAAPKAPLFPNLAGSGATGPPTLPLNVVEQLARERPVEEQLVELLERWCEAQARGVEIGVSTLCEDCPDLADELRRQIGFQRRIEDLLGDADGEPAVTHTILTNGDRSIPAAPEHPFLSPPTKVHSGPDEKKTPWPTLPDYEILEELGEGGMGVVFKARQVSLNRLVAIKMVSGSHRGAENRKRFYREAKAIARLQHPNIVQIHEVGEHQGQPFFSLELCPGGSLDRRLADVSFEPRAAAELIACLARAMHAAHQAGVIHRDLKPGNVLFAADGAPRITDFGLAKQVDLPAQTHHGEVMGTPSYMPPEQAFGSIAEIGPAADVYALGAILYELLTGRPPFRGATNHEILMRVRFDEPLPPARLQPRTPRDLETICLKCLYKEPGRRYPTAQELADDLRRFLDGEPIKARRTPALERAWKWVRRRPALAAVIVLLVVALLSASAVGVFYLREQHRHAERLARQAQRREAFLAKVGRLLQQGKDDSAAGELALAKGRFDDATRRFGAALATLDTAAGELEANPDPRDQELRADAQQALDAVRRRLALHEAGFEVRTNTRLFLNDLHFAIQLLQVSLTQQDEAGNRARLIEAAPKALALFARRSSSRLLDHPQDVVLGLKEKRDLFESPEKFAQVAEGCYEILLAWADAEAQSAPAPSRAPGGPRTALTLLKTAESLARECELQTPTPRTFFVRKARYLDLVGEKIEANQARAQAARLTANSALDHFLIALEQMRAGRPSLAEHSCQLALSHAPTHLWARYLLALCQLLGGKEKEGEVTLTVCLRWRRDFLAGWLHRGIARMRQKNLTGAEKDFAAALKLSVAQKDDFSRYVILINRAGLWLDKQDWAKARADLENAIELRRDDPLAYHVLARQREARRNWKGAVAAWSEALRLLEKNLPQLIGRELAEARMSRADWYRRRARAQEMLGDLDAAERDLSVVIRLGRRATGLEHYLGALTRRAALREETGREQLALADYRAAGEGLDAWLAWFKDQIVEGGVSVAPLPGPSSGAAAKTPLLPNLTRRSATRDEVFNAWLARGMIHERLGQDASAEAAYGQALRLRDDVEARLRAGWVKLRLGANGDALVDFNRALALAGGQRPAGTFDALCGRGLALARLGRLRDAATDARAALASDASRDRRLRPEDLVQLACVHATIARQALHLDRGGRMRDEAEDEVFNLLTRALDRTQRKQRRAFWQVQVLKKEVLAALRNHSRFRELERSYLR